MNVKHIGFGTFLDDDEIVQYVFRCTFPLLRIVLHLVLWGVLAGVLGWFFYDTPYFVIILIPTAFGLFRVFAVFMRWHSNAILMTNESLMFVEWDKPFHSRAVRLDYWDLDDIVYERAGMASTFAIRADLEFEKVGGGDSYVFVDARRPRRVIRIIRDYKEKILDEKNFTEESALKDLLSQNGRASCRERV